MITIEKVVFAAALPFAVFAGLILGRFLFVAVCLVLYRARRRHGESISGSVK